MRKREHGYGVLLTILGVATVASALAVSLSSASDATAMMRNQAQVSTLVAQASLIRSRILQCGIEYPEGDNGTGFRPPYPAEPNPSPSVSLLTCPGSGQSLWDSADAVSMPTQVSGFSSWSYSNDAVGMSISTTAPASDYSGVANKVAAQLGADAVVSLAGGDVVLDWFIAR